MDHRRYPRSTSPVGSPDPAHHTGIRHPAHTALRAGQARPLLAACVLAVSLATSLPGIGMAAAGEEPDAATETLRATLFGTADRARAAAEAADAHVLAPIGHARGESLYEKAATTLDKGGNLETIQRNLAEAGTLFDTAVVAATDAARFFEVPLRARQRAQFAGAARYAEEAWAKAEETLADAARSLERGRAESAGKAMDRITAAYEAAELAAIKANYLQQTRNLLAQADDLKARKTAPESWTRAKSLLAEAEAALEEDRYDTDRPRNLARMAEERAYQAVYVAGLERRIRDDETSLEEIINGWEDALRRVADLLEVPVQFDTGPDTAVVSINRAIDTLQTELSELRQNIAERDEQIAGLSAELGGKTASLDRVNQILARQERQRARVAEVRTLFEPGEAIVLQQDDAVVLRLIGLGFASGSATLGASQAALLEKIRTALTTFPESTVVIEGHTDSFGSDTANQQLSQARAESLLAVLVQSGTISPLTSTAIGFGESRPVASNETPEGRRRNRRIDIIVHGP